MAPMKLEITRSPKQKPNDKAVTVAFTNGSGITRESWFSSPPMDIDHVCLGYLSGRFSNVKNDGHVSFIKRRFKEEMSKIMEVCKDGKS